MEQQLAIGICIVLGLMLILKEVFRSDKGRLVWRVLASLLAVASLYLLLFPLKYQDKKIQQTNELLFLTTGANVDSIAPGMKGFTDDVYLHQQHSDLIYVPDLPYYLASHLEYSKLKLYGYGLEKEVLKQLKGYSIEFHPTEITGFSDIHWSRKLKSSQEFKVQGTYFNSEGKALKLFLKGLGAKQDSVMLPPGISTKFSLKARPQLIGKAVYELQILKGRDTLDTEPLPFIVEEATTMRVLMLSSFPDFEFKFLKNWLYENKYAVTFRTQISKDKFSTDYLNTADKGFTRINAALLNRIDVLILDEDTHQGLGLQEKSTLNQAVKSGMGMLLLGKQKQALRIKGEGKVLVSAAQETYRLPLAGKTTEYAALWSDLLTAVARRKTDPMTWVMAPQFPVQGHRSSVIIDIPQKTGVPTININETRYPVLQNMEMLFQWQITSWPKNTGWNRLEVNENKDFFYVFKPMDWESIRSAKLIQSTEENISDLEKRKVADLPTGKETKMLSLWWISILFTACAGYLWYEQRFLCNKIK